MLVNVISTVQLGEQRLVAHITLYTILCMYLEMDVTPVASAFIELFLMNFIRTY